MFEKVSRSLKYDSNIFFVHKHKQIYYMDTRPDHLTPLALRVRGYNGYIAGPDLENSKKGVLSVPLILFKLSLSLSFFSILSPLPFSILSLLPFLISPSLSSIPSCSSDQFSVFLRFTTCFIQLLNQAPLACGSNALTSVLFPQAFETIWCMPSQIFSIFHSIKISSRPKNSYLATGRVGRRRISLPTISKNAFEVPA